MHDDAVVSWLQVLDDKFTRIIGLRRAIDVFVGRVHSDKRAGNGGSRFILHCTANAAEGGLRMRTSREHNRPGECYCRAHTARESSE